MLMRGARLLRHLGWDDGGGGDGEKEEAEGGHTSINSFFLKLILNASQWYCLSLAIFWIAASTSSAQFKFWAGQEGG